MSSSPKYDTRIARKGGYMWASECDLEGLQYWCAAKSRPSTNPKYADKDKADAKRLGYWVAFREADPYSRWKGVRGEGEVVAAQPSAKPTIHSWDAPAAKPVERGDSWEGGEDDPLPF